MIKQIKLINLSTWFFWHLYRQHGGFRKEERSKGPSSSLLTPTSSLKYSSLWPREAKESKSHIKNKIKWFFFFLPFFPLSMMVSLGFSSATSSSAFSSALFSSSWVCSGAASVTSLSSSSAALSASVPDSVLLVSSAALVAAAEIRRKSSRWDTDSSLEWYWSQPRLCVHSLFSTH